VFEIHVDIGRPERAPQLADGNDLTGSAEEHLEELHGLTGQTQAPALVADFAGAEIQGEVSKAGEGRSVGIGHE
jgi:hypothetical protein